MISQPNHDASLNTGLEAVLEHMVAQSEQMMHLQMQVSYLSDLVRHQNSELSDYFSRPSMKTNLPPHFNPLTDERPIPNPRTETPESIREMLPVEKNILAQSIQSCLIDTNKRNNCRRIVDPDNWSGSENIDIDVTSLDAHTNWKLWHLVRLNKSINAVLTADELAASKSSFRAGHASSSSPMGAASSGVHGSRSPSLIIPCDANQTRKRQNINITVVKRTTHCRGAVKESKNAAREQGLDCVESDDEEACADLRRDMASEDDELPCV